MASQLIDSRIYGSAWGTPELRAIFDEEARVRAWLEILAVLAETKASSASFPRTWPHASPRAAAGSGRIRFSGRGPRRL